jgi:predicted nucleotidyltransferase component of viral defense system
LRDDDARASLTMTANRPASVRARLLNLAKQSGTDFNLMLVRFALERFLFRLSASEHADRFVLKGDLLFTLWYGLTHRATRDADLLGFGANDTDSIAAALRTVCEVEGDDGIVFDPASVRVAEIRKDARYVGVRATMNAVLDGARCVVQVDVGFGDAVTPAPKKTTYPVLLADLAAPRLRTYPVETVIAEKLHAIAVLGMANSRLKDYLDLVVIVEREQLDQAMLSRAVAATFARRGTPLPSSLPVGLSDEYATDPTRVSLWAALLEKNGIVPRPLNDVVAVIRDRLAPTLGVEPLGPETKRASPL